MTIGTIELTIGGTTKRSNNGQHVVAVDWENLPEVSRAYLIRYGLKQCLADAAAGAGSNDQLKSAVDARLAKLLSGDLTRQRTGEGKPDTVTSIALRLAKEAIRARAKAAKVELSKDKVQAAAEAFLKRDDDAAKAMMKEAQRQLDARAKLGEANDADTLLADLGLI